MIGPHSFCRTRAETVPVVLAVLLLTSAIAYGADLTASWVDNSLGLARTRIERRLDTDVAFHEIADLPPGVTMYVDTSVVAGQTYCYRAMAYDGDEVSPYSEESCGVVVDRLSIGVNRAGNGSGTVTSTPPGILCGTACSAVFPAGTVVLLSATPGAGATFLGWSGGGCAGVAPCVVAGNARVAMTANFSPSVRPSATASVPTALSGRCAVSGGEVGVPYAASCTVTGGSAPYSCTVAAGSLPPGLSLGRDCRFTGTPASAGTRSFTARVIDAAGRVLNASGSVSVLPPVTITTASLSRATVDRSFSTMLTAAGGRGPYRWSVVEGILPPGLALDLARGAIGGSPTALGVSEFTIRVRDALGATADRHLQLVVNRGPLTATCVPPFAEVDVPFFDACMPRAGLPPYTCTVVDGTLPSGLLLNPDCTLRGTAAAAGTRSFRARVSDSGGLSAVIGGRISVQPHVAVTTATLPNATANRSYVTTLAATGGVRPYRWTLGAGTLPPGVALDGSLGQIIGRPTDLGVTTVTLRVRDALGATAERPLLLVVNRGPLTATCRPGPAEVDFPYAGACALHAGLAPYACDVIVGAPPPGLTLNHDCTITGTPTIRGTVSFTTRVTDAGGSALNVQSYVVVQPRLALATTVVPSATVNQALVAALVASGGVRPYAWNVVGGVLPTGLALDPMRGQIAGVPAVDGVAEFTVRVSDARGASSERRYTLVVNHEPPIASCTLVAETIDVPYAAACSSSVGLAPEGCAMIGGAMPGLNTDCSVSGPPTTP